MSFKDQLLKMCFRNVGGKNQVSCEAVGCRWSTGDPAFRLSREKGRSGFRRNLIALLPELRKSERCIVQGCLSPKCPRIVRKEFYGATCSQYSPKDSEPMR